MSRFLDIDLIFEFQLINKIFYNETVPQVFLTYNVNAMSGEYQMKAQMFLIKNIPKFLYGKVFKHTIILNKKQEPELLKYLPGFQNSKLLYRGSVTDFEAERFVIATKGKSPTICLV